MYGLLLQGITGAIKDKFGEKVWLQILEKSGIPHSNFHIHKCYSETLIPRLTKAAVEVTGCKNEELMNIFGANFVRFVGNYGYDRILRVLGRNLRDFLSGLDNLHEYLRFSFTKLKPPSFFVEDESPSGLTLHYRTRRKGYLFYVMGQIKAVGELFYRTPVEISIIKEEDSLDLYYVVMRLEFENTAYLENKEIEATDEINDDICISSQIFFDMFPFHIVFDKSMIICNVGSGLESVMKGVVGHAVDEMFQLVRPLVEFTLENVSFRSHGQVREEGVE